MKAVLILRNGSGELPESGDPPLPTESSLVVPVDPDTPDTGGMALLRKLERQTDIPMVMVVADEEALAGLCRQAERDDIALHSKLKSLLESQTAAGGEGDCHGEAVIRGPIQLQASSRQVVVRGKPVQLKNREFELLHFFMINPNTVFSKEHLYRCIWGEKASGNVNTVTVHINRIRDKLEEDPSRPCYLQTVWGVGYRFSV